MPDQSTPRRMVIAVDGSAASKAAVTWAANDAALRKLTITLLHVNSSPMASFLPTESRRYAAMTRRDREAQEILEEAAAIVAAIAGGNASAVGREVHTGHPVDALVEQSKNADLVVVGFRGNGLLGQHLLGPVTEGVLRHAHCPVAVVRTQQGEDPVPTSAPVVVGVDGSANSDRAVELAFEEAQLRGVTLVAVHAASDQSVSSLTDVDRPAASSAGAETLRNVLSPWQRRYPGVEVEAVVTCDRPSVELISRSQTAQLVVVGSHGRGGFAGMMLGSVSSAVVRSADVPVIVARPPI